MSSNLDIRLIEVGYFLSRLGTKSPPVQLNSENWKDAYSKFYGSLGGDKSEDEFKNSLKNLRDHFDSHLNNSRTGWLASDGTPQKLSASNQKVLDRFKNWTPDELWNQIRPLVITSYSSKLAKKKNNEVRDSGGKFFSSEFSGNKSFNPTETTEAIVLHGFVVDSLKVFVEESFKHTLVFNTQKIDLAIDLDGQITKIYEVKTSTDTQSIYTAVGQLFMHSAGMHEVEKVIVLPKPFDNHKTTSCLASLGIQTLWYSIIDDECSFDTND